MQQPSQHIFGFVYAPNEAFPVEFGDNKSRKFLLFYSHGRLITDEKGQIQFDQNNNALVDYTQNGIVLFDQNYQKILFSRFENTQDLSTLPAENQVNMFNGIITPLKQEHRDDNNQLVRIGVTWADFTSWVKGIPNSAVSEDFDSPTPNAFEVETVQETQPQQEQKTEPTPQQNTQQNNQPSQQSNQQQSNNQSNQQTNTQPAANQQQNQNNQPKQNPQAQGQVLADVTRILSPLWQYGVSLYVQQGPQALENVVASFTQFLNQSSQQQKQG